MSEILNKNNKNSTTTTTTIQVAASMKSVISNTMATGNGTNKLNNATTNNCTGNTAIPAPVAMPQGIPITPLMAAAGVTSNGVPPGESSKVVSVGGSNGSEASQSDVTSDNLANTKEKTPMCLINELARFNKVQHQYVLTDEQGPAHKKVFLVKLLLGDKEEYFASGPSIKKAQHVAAAQALENTQFKHPPPKQPKTSVSLSEWPQSLRSKSVTATVELNAIAMKRGELAEYRVIEMPQPQFYPPPSLDFRGMYNQRYHYPRFPRVYYVSLKVGQREFIGQGTCRQGARHNAAEKAIHILHNLPVTAEKKLEPKPPSPTEAEAVEEADDEDVIKSEISLVHEIALKRNMNVDFKVIHESGPPHMRQFVTSCRCGTFETQGEGNSKKLSKKRAAVNMLEELRKLPPLPPSVLNRPKKALPAKKKQRNIVKKAAPDYGVGINPISRLIQIQQAKKEREPIYSLVMEQGLPRHREFVMEVCVGDRSCTGVGPNKKLAKRSAAEAMLQLLGYSRPVPQPTKPAIKTSSDTSNLANSADKKVTFFDTEGNSTSRQLAPGLILMPEGARLMNSNSPSDSTVSNTNQPYSPLAQVRSSGLGGTSPVSPLNRAPGAPLQTMAGGTEQVVGVQTTMMIAKELLETGYSPTGESLRGTTGNGVHDMKLVRPKQQLLYLADILGVQVQFTDLPKGCNKSDYTSLVSLLMKPPRLSHGSGPTVESSHDMASHAALKSLGEIGLREKVPDNVGAGDGPHVKTEASTAGEKRASSEIGIHCGVAVSTAAEQIGSN